MEIKGKVAIVTGASGGIGEATARLLSQKGAKVVVAARSEEKLNKLVREIGGMAVKTDMTAADQIKNLAEKTMAKFGRIDILVNNAGVGYDAAVEKIDMETWRKVIELDLVGQVEAMQAVIPVMRKQGGGVIVNISSGTALMALPNMGAYSAIKRALVGISLTARNELAADKIGVSVVYPYSTATDFEANTIKGEEVKAEWRREGNRQPPAADSPKVVAEKIVEAIGSGADEVMVHDFMKGVK